MKKTSVSIMYDDEKLNAIKSVDSLYAKYVPANVREFIDMKSVLTKPPKPKKQKPQEENTEVAT